MKEKDKKEKNAKTDAESVKNEQETAENPENPAVKDFLVYEKALKEMEKSYNFTNTITAI